MEKTRVNTKKELDWIAYKKASELLDEAEMALFTKLGKKHILDEHCRLCDELEKVESKETEQKIDQLLIEYETIIKSASCKEKDDWDNARSKVDDAIEVCITSFNNGVLQ